MNCTAMTLSLAACLFTHAAPQGPADPPAGEPATKGPAAAQHATEAGTRVAEALTIELERRAKDVLGELLDQKALEIAQRLRVRAPRGSTAAPESSDDTADSVGELAPEVDPYLASLTAIEARLCALETLLAEVAARTAPPAPAVPLGGPITAGYEWVRVRTWHHDKDVSIQIVLNGLAIGRFDTDTTLDLRPFLQPGRSNQLAFTISPRGKADATGMEVTVEASMPGRNAYVAILQFKAAKERLTDALEIPFAAP